jgi:hypothetical protein
MGKCLLLRSIRKEKKKGCFIHPNLWHKLSGRTLSHSGSKGNLFLAAPVPVEKIREELAGKSEFVAVIFDEKEGIVTLRRNERKTYTLTREVFSSVPRSLFLQASTYVGLSSGTPERAGLRFLAGITCEK